MNRSLLTGVAVTTAVLLTMLAGMSGCENRQVMAPGAGEPDPLPAHAYPQIAALEKLDRYLAFGEPVVKGQDAADRPLMVTVPVRVRSDRDIHVQYRFEFFDADKQPIEPMMDWRYMQLQARAQQFMQASSLDSQARDWRLLVRPAR